MKLKYLKLDEIKKNASTALYKKLSSLNAKKIIKIQ